MTKAFNSIVDLREEAKLIFELILKKGPLTKSEILDITKIKLSTLGRIMQPLEDKGLIIESSIGESTGGRKPVLYDVNPKGAYIIGIDISRTYVQMVMTDLKMNILHQEYFEVSASITPMEIIQSVLKFKQDTYKQLSIADDMVAGIGIGAVGPLDRTTGITLNPKWFSSLDWRNVPIKNLIEEKTGLTAVIDNGANMAALAEHFFGEGKGLDNIVYINCGIGIRTGAISSGTIIRTMNDAEDAFGHMVIDIDGTLCNCGNYGCVECYASLLSITKNYIRELKKGRATSIKKQLEHIHYSDICLAAESDDELAKEVIMSAATAFGVGLANYINLLSPYLVILSGPLVKYSRLFYETSKNTALKRIYLKSDKTVLFSRSGVFKEYAMAVGAASAVIDHVLRLKDS